MMNKDVPSYELCKKLKELGYKRPKWQKKGWIYHPQKRYLSHMMKYVGWGTVYRRVLQISMHAPTIWEMMDVLPDYIDHEWCQPSLLVRKEQCDGDNEYWVYYDWNWYESPRFIEKSLPNALAKMLIRCIENNHLDLTTKDERDKV